MKMLLGSCLIIVCMLFGSNLPAQDSGSTFKKTGFYNVMAGKSADAINQQLDLLKNLAEPEKTAYEGALLMKKAGVTGGPKKKLDLFKAGHKKLEAALREDSSNVEFRFLRLMIQENAPGILGYKGELEKDKLYIKNNFKKLPPVVQQAVRDYSKESRILKQADL